ncbi:hypothetical protein NLU13_7221 [Sarocladium strictum]|uniref:Potassium channel domain-containing protein n=1 Tax=Sarocladium strictum TaxID=5046 RepID=A0AA39GCE1_SARSR|nr:hypothetical protein NLU13_7221 [Sarocladium strictum]
MDDSAGEHIDQHADDADRQLDTRKTSRVTNDEAHLVATRWWFASSAFPMIAGTLGPTASAFSICSLVRPWRQQLLPGDSVDDAAFITDPLWLTIVNAIQLLMALVSNVFLLLNMTRRVRFTIAQPITIVGWYISAILLFVLLACANGPLLEDIKYPRSENVWSQAFYYGIWASILYFVDASLMVVTFYGAWSGRYSKDFMLSSSQRTLMLQTIAFLIYLLVGALVFSKIEGWDYLDGLYWADVTLFTVGFGDITPTSTLSRALMIPYALIGIITLGLVIGSIRSMILERGKRRMDSRMEEKKRHQIVKAMVKRGTDSILRPMPTDKEGSSERELTPDEMKWFKRAPTNEFERRQHEFNLMREIQRRATVRRRWVDLGISTSCWLLIWMVGAVVFMNCEEPYQDRWTYFDAFYFCFVSLVTIGYGDVYPISNGGRSFFVFWSMLALPTMTILISNAGDTVVKFIKDATLRVGSVTILPGEAGFVAEIKHILCLASRGRLFPSHSNQPKPTPAPRRALITDLESSDSVILNSTNNNDPSQGDRASPPSHQQLNLSTASMPHLRDPLADLPTGQEFLYILACEIQEVASHLHHSQPRRYSFEEWAWYLKLIGEDERDPELHRGPKPKEVRLDPEGQPVSQRHKRRRRKKRRHRHDGEVDRERAGSLDHDEREGGHKWSWVGTRNPLMGGKEESEWIIERLTERLKEAILDDIGDQE